MKNGEKREVRSHNKVCALLAKNKVRSPRAEQLVQNVHYWLTRLQSITALSMFFSGNAD